MNGFWVGALIVVLVGFDAFLYGLVDRQPAQVTITGNTIIVIGADRPAPLVR